MVRGRMSTDQSLRLCGNSGGSGSSCRRRGKVLQGTILFDHATILTWSVCSPDQGPVGFLLHFRCCAVHRRIIVSVCGETLSAEGCCEGLLAVADKRTRGQGSAAVKGMVTSVTKRQRVSACITLGHGLLPPDLTGILSLLCGVGKTKEGNVSSDRRKQIDHL